MRLVYVIPGVGGGGGTEKSLAAMVPHWARTLEVHIVTFSDRMGLAEQLMRDGARVTNLGKIDRAKLFWVLARMLRAERPDLVHTSLWDADIAGRIAAAASATPVSSSLVNVNYGTEQRGAPGLNRFKLRVSQLADIATARGVSRFHAPSAHVASVMSSRLLVPRERIDVIARGRDPSTLGERTVERYASARGRLGVREEPLIVAAARHEWQKGLDVLVRAIPQVLRSVPNARILIGGREGNQTTSLERLIQQLHLEKQVMLIGHRDDVPELLCAADVFCIPSRWEGCPGVLIEAMCLGVPTVASDIAPVREVAGPQPWVTLVGPEDPAALAAGIVHTLQDAGHATEQVARGRHRFMAGFTAEHVAGLMVQFFERAASSSRWHRQASAK